MRSFFSMIVIPVIIACSCYLSQIMRGGHRKTVMRLTDVALNSGNTRDIKTLKEVDLMIFSMGRGAMRIWARLLLRDKPVQGLDIEQARK